MRANKLVAWMSYAICVILSWAIVAFYLFIAGGASCKWTETCLIDDIVVAAAILLLPVQAVGAAWLRSRLR